MYLDFFGLRDQPFGVTPDPAFLYLSRTHREALEALRSDLLTDRGFMALVGEPGLGKTTLLYKLLDEWSPTSRVVFLFQTHCDSLDFFRYLLAELGVDAESMGLVAMHHKLNHFLFQEMLAGRRFIFIVDEAQNLDDSVLETVRGLSNFETPHVKLLNIVLAGQSQLADKLESPGLRQLRQRIGFLNRLRPLTAIETSEYIKHRLGLVGYCGESIFTLGALQAIAQASQGAPRSINHICHQALCAAAKEGVHTINLGMTQNVIARLEDRTLEVSSWSAPAPVETELVLATEPTSISEPASASEPLRVLESVSVPESVLVPESALVSEPVSVADPVLVDEPTFVSEPALVPELFPVSNAIPVPAPGSPIRPAPQPAPPFSYGSSGKSPSKRWGSAAIASCVLLLIGAACTIPSVRRFARQEYKNLTSSILSKASASAAAASPQLSSATEITSPVQAPDSENGRVVVMPLKNGQTIAELSRLYLGHFDEDTFEQIRALNPDVKDFDHLDVGQLIQLPVSPDALKKGVDTGDPLKVNEAGKWPLLIARMRDFLADKKR